MVAARNKPGEEEKGVQVQGTEDIAEYSERAVGKRICRYFSS
ncbi:hypothetical protein NCCP2331_32900 [Sporosarcina sp. NCCP-2331]|nr:hypothetical protein NCCP2331_32900 [Sporosarcina sp. NCCP-2331]GLB57467.1 hypothetical protein NCCP2378_32550 [Sporosarcina sp. NCCP-2378]